MEFKDFELHEDALKAVSKLGFTTPSEIQEKAIPVLLEGNRDFVGLAQTGTGKTAAFGLPLIQHTDFNNKTTQALVICPTRELCMQITKDLESYAIYKTDPNILPVYGGSSIDDQIRRIKKGAHIVVATPGRLLDLIKRKAIKLNTVKIVVLDEADEMLNMGFKEDIDSILEQTPAKKRVWLFSATMPKDVRRIANNYMEDPLEVVIGRQNSPAANIEHRYYMIKEKDRYHALKRILDYYPDIFGLVFCRTRRETGSVSEKLEKEGYNVVALHGDLSQGQRDAAMKKFRERTVKVLVATDVAARGIDVNDISHVIHYNLPDELEVYTHRSGRTARAGRSGFSLTLINTRESNKIRQVEKIIGEKIEFSRIPGSEEICEKQMYALMDKVIETPVDEVAIDRYWPVIYKKLKDFPAEDIVMKFISTELNTFLNYYKNSGDLNAKQEAGRGGQEQGRWSGERSRSGGERSRSGGERSRSGGERSRYGGERSRSDGKPNRNLDGPTERFFMNLGERQNMNKGALVRLICTETGIESNQVGRIEVLPGFTFFEVDGKAASKILPKIGSGTYEGKTFSIEISKEKDSQRTTTVKKRKRN